jgi:hypothetical protein
MLTGQLLNSQATINQYTEISNVSFVPGSSVTVILQMIQDQLNIRYFEDNANATIEFTFPGSNGNDVVKAGTFPFNDRSIIKCVLDSTDTENLQGGNFTFKIDVNGDGTQILQGFVNNGLTRQLVGAC